jgi:hypothetical protein
MTRWILTDVTRSAYSNLISKNSKIALVVVALAGVCLGQQANAGTIVALPDAVWSGVNRAYGVGPPRLIPLSQVRLYVVDAPV